MEKRVIDQAEQIRCVFTQITIFHSQALTIDISRELEGLIQTVLEILERNDEISRPSSISSSRSSSVDSVDSRRSSTGQPTPAGDGAEALTEEDQSANAFGEILENLSALDDFFDRFILDSDHTALVERLERIQTSSAAFVEAATDQLGSYLGETEAPLQP
ncbi:hypothetical protein LCI18_005537 [Fusarium solani-melongenae]|uniref:Uncharacterized protein n=1 Tax=Fusarium solani subsp. cucurbitae TaxID=2747967 RepID=A0ACD3Z072_FUSSC|nr:hypothetical protein LCI18_005537 [Fusarium solani-melongenae]